MIFFFSLFFLSKYYLAVFLTNAGGCWGGYTPPSVSAREARRKIFGLLLARKFFFNAFSAVKLGEVLGGYRWGVLGGVIPTPAKWGATPLR